YGRQGEGGGRVGGGGGGGENGHGEAARDGRRERVEPSHLEPVGAKRLVLASQLDELLVVRGKPQAAGPLQCVAGNLLQAIEGVLSQPPESGRRVASDGFRGDVVRGRPAAEREAAVASAGPARDPAR